jgi:hypothetical protein
VSPQVHRPDVALVVRRVLGRAGGVEDLGPAAARHDRLERHARGAEAAAVGDAQVAEHGGGDGRVPAVGLEQRGRGHRAEQAACVVVLRGVGTGGGEA